MTPDELAAKLPPGFLLGVSTSAYQIEGGADERGPAGWDHFAAESTTILDGSNALVAADHYHRMPEDVALLKDLGVDAYRFSISWPRVQPTGSGSASAKGLAFYDRLLDELLDAGIRPMATLFHWDTPLEIDEAGGWAKRDTAYRFADYVRIAGEAFGDRVADWVTVNEPATLALEGYTLDVHSPATALWVAGARAAHHLLLGHGLAVRALREVPVTGRIGISNAHTPVFPASSRWRDRFAARNFDILSNRVFADPVLLGKRPPGLVGLAVRLAALPHWGDRKIMAEPVDFYGVQYYFPSKVAAGPPHVKVGTHDGHSKAMLDLPLRLEPWPEYGVTGFGWPDSPDQVPVLLHRLAERYGSRLPPIIFTEGGASFPDHPERSGAVDDVQRIEYLGTHLAEAAAAVPGVEVEGYFVWSLLDNFEWAAGYTQKFGLVSVDPETQERRPKASFDWYREVLSARKR
ncbi:glycoside hydrolase family 1 protein [Pseudolysinimonas sp.]|uniref:glycoside hydrolase family 1 protein n=1 Tax=Pseudolysinimonas sp. TaxID=2680009 RepID=UPI0037837A33